MSTPQPSASPPSSSNKIDPHALLKTEISHVRSSLLNLLGPSDSTLSEVASYYFHHKSKQLRPLLVLLFSRATNGLGSHFPLKLRSAEHARLSSEQLDAPLSRPDVLNDFNPFMLDHTASFNSPFDLRPPPTITLPSPPPSLCAESAVSLSQLAHTLPSQLRLAQIVEMIHVASLLHDDVIDKSDLRRGAPSAPATFGNKLSVLGGDFLLARASAALSRLGDNEVIGLVSTMVTNLVEGEILQMKGTGTRSNVDSSASSEVGLSGLHLPSSYAEAVSLVHASSGISRTRDLAQTFAEKAREALGVLPASEAKEALEALTEMVVRRGW